MTIKMVIVAEERFRYILRIQLESEAANSTLLRNREKNKSQLVAYQFEIGIRFQNMKYFFTIPIRSERPSWHLIAFL